MKANEIKKGFAVSLNGKSLIVKDIEVQNPSARGAATLYKMRFTDLATGLKVEERFKGDEHLTLIDLSRRFVSYSYTDGTEVIFMDNEDYTQYSFDQQDISDELQYITEETQGLVALLVDGKCAALELPSTVELVITETPPGMRGASATSRTKPATLTTGLVVQVPEYIENGEKIKINTAECRYISRAE